MKKPTPKLRTLDNYHLNVSSGQLRLHARASAAREQ